MEVAKDATHFITKDFPRKTKKIQSSLKLTNAAKVMQKYMPEGSELSIEETDGKLIAKYLVRAVYTSKRSGKTMSITAKGDSLPETKKDDLLIRYYISQLALTKEKAAARFSDIAWKNRRAKQDAFLFGGGVSRGNETRVSDAEEQIDNMSFKVRNA